MDNKKSNLIQEEKNFNSFLGDMAAGISEMNVQNTTGTANAILLSGITAFTNGKKYSFKAMADSTGLVTVNGKTLKKNSTTQATTGDIKNGKIYDFYYDSTADSLFILAKASGNATIADVLAGKTFSNSDGTDLIGTLAGISYRAVGGYRLYETTGVVSLDSTKKYIIVAVSSGSDGVGLGHDGGGGGNVNSKYVLNTASINITSLTNTTVKIDGTDLIAYACVNSSRGGAGGAGAGPISGKGGSGGNYNYGSSDYSGRGGDGMPSRYNLFPLQSGGIGGSGQGQTFHGGSGGGGGIIGVGGNGGYGSEYAYSSVGGFGGSGGGGGGSSGSCVGYENDTNHPGTGGIRGGGGGASYRKSPRSIGGTGFVLIVEVEAIKEEGVNSVL